MRAPITGTILEKAVEPGTVIASSTSNVSGGAVLMKMADLTEVQVRTRVDETDIGKIKPGMITRVTVAAYPNQPFDGTVLKIEPQAIVEQNVTMFSVLIKLPNPGGVLKPGMNADVQIQIADHSSVAAVPTAALRADSDIELTAKMLGMDEARCPQIWRTVSHQDQRGRQGRRETANGPWSRCLTASTRPGRGAHGKHRSGQGFRPRIERAPSSSRRGFRVAAAGRESRAQRRWRRWRWRRWRWAARRLPGRRWLPGGGGGFPGGGGGSRAAVAGAPAAPGGPARRRRVDRVSFQRRLLGDRAAQRLRSRSR